MSGSEPTATSHLDPETARGQIVRFGLLGGTNTAVTAGAFYLLALVIPAQAAFTIVYAAGVAFVTLTTPRLVFGTSAPWRRRVLLGLWYFGTYVVGLGMISLLETALDAARIVVVLGTVCVTAPLGFLGARMLVSGTRQSAGGNAPSG
jgi:putative flippase GtrA